MYKTWMMALFIDFEATSDSYNSINNYNVSCKNNSQSQCGFNYHTYDPESGVISDFIRGVFYNTTAKVYTTYPSIYKLTLCKSGATRNHENNRCSNPDSDTTTFNYRSKNQFFYPNSGKFLHLSDYLEYNTCPIGTCVLPDFDINNKGYCLLIPNNINHIKSCSKTESIYYNNFICEDGYQRVYYDCISNNLVKGSAMYFSNFYSFPNLIFNPKDELDSLNLGAYNTQANDLGRNVILPNDKRLTSYYLEFWFKLDYLNDPVSLTENEYYFYGYPHSIIRNSSDKSFKYSNQQISGGAYHYSLTTIHSYEWNRIIIENKFNGDAKIFRIKVYVNYDFTSPQVDISTGSDQGKMHFRGIVFCNGLSYKNNECKIGNDILHLHWGIAWYKNIRVWNGDITSLKLIQSCEYGYTEIIKSLKYYFPFTVDYIEQNTVLGKVNNEKFIEKFWYYGRDYNNDFRENYSGEEMDYSGLNPNNYISGVNDDGNNYVLTECYEACKRCYCIAENACYECRTGYILYERTCL